MTMESVYLSLRQQLRVMPLDGMVRLWYAVWSKHQIWDEIFHIRLIRFRYCRIDFKGWQINQLFSDFPYINRNVAFNRFNNENRREGMRLKSSLLSNAQINAILSLPISFEISFRGEVCSSRIFVIWKYKCKSPLSPRFNSMTQEV